MATDQYTYRVIWSPEDGEHVGLCTEFPLLSCLASTTDEAFNGIRHLVKEVVIDMEKSGERPPASLSHHA